MTSHSDVQFDAATHTYYDALGVRKPSVTWILAQSGLCDFSFVEDEVRARAMQRGRSVHWLLQLEDEGRLNYRAVPKALRPYRMAYLAWKRNSGFIPQLIEAPFLSNFGFAGTLDRYGRLPATAMYPRGSRALVDFKTGSVQEWVAIQLAAYSLRIHSNPVLARMVRRIGLGLKEDGSYQVREFPAETWEIDFAKFLEAKKRVEERTECLTPQ